MEGPHASLPPGIRFTDGNGEATFSFVGKDVGVDTIRVETRSGELLLSRDAKVSWSGGPDLGVPFFIPPLIVSQGGNPVYISDITENTGTTPAGISTTRYYISQNPPPFDLADAKIIGERVVPSLGPNIESEVLQSEFVIPGDLPEGQYHVAACADADHAVSELDEMNNCSFNQFETSITTNIVPTIQTDNSPPVCNEAIPTVADLWPPNHKLMDINVSNVTDPDNDVVDIRIDGITQDEPVNGVGDGDTSPDGVINNDSTFKLRAERSGNGNGRVYRIIFTAKDDQGDSCTGSVQVGVPHDKGKGTVPLDDGQIYDSTQSV